MKILKNAINAEPNIGHKILADWEAKELVDTIVTQNIDGLHQKSGSKKVIEFHGTINSYTLCSNNQKKFNLEELLDNNNQIKYYHNGIKEKNHLIRPDIVLFGDSIPNLYKASNSTIGVDLMIIIGTSFEVYPFNQFADFLSPCDNVIVINQHEIDVNTRANVMQLNGEIIEILPEINKYL